MRLHPDGSIVHGDVDFGSTVHAQAFIIQTLTRQMTTSANGGRTIFSANHLFSICNTGQREQRFFDTHHCLEVSGRQGISLRGHRDNGAELTSDSKNLGNFEALLNLQIDAEDQDLKEHLEKCNRNATYISKQSQNELQACRKSQIQNVIVDEIKEQRDEGALYG